MSETTDKRRRKVPKPFTVWATMSPADRFSRRRPNVCIWGTRADAETGRDSDEEVCQIRVEVLKVAGR